MRHIKVVVVGDGAIGKTCLLLSFTTNVFPGEYIPTVYDNYSINLMVESQTCSLQLWDTAGQEDLKKQRIISYPGADAVIIAFSLTSPTSLDNVKNYWRPEVKEFLPNVPFILIGTKSDLRDKMVEGDRSLMVNGSEPVPTANGEEMAKKLGAKAYVECSALKGTNTAKVFDETVKVVLHYRDDAVNEVPASNGGCCEVI